MQVTDVPRLTSSVIFCSYCSLRSLHSRDSKSDVVGDSVSLLVRKSDVASLAVASIHADVFEVLTDVKAVSPGPAH